MTIDLAALPDDVETLHRMIGELAAALDSHNNGSASRGRPAAADRQDAPARPLVLGRKNHLFAGSDGGAERRAVIASLIATAKLNHVEPHAYLKDVLERMTTGLPMSRIDELLPWNWKASRGRT